MERLISADSHVNLTDNGIKSHLATKHHHAFNNALHTFGQVDPKRLVVSYQFRSTTSTSR